MMRFLLGVLIGGCGVYWYLTGEIPMRQEVEAWFSRTASSYTAERRRTEADRLIEEGRPAATAKR